MSDVPNGRLWIVGVKEEPPEGVLLVEAERWFDVRTFARQVFGREVHVVVLPEDLPMPRGARHQLRWEGLAARNPPDLRLVVRELGPNGPLSKWRRV